MYQVVHLKYSSFLSDFNQSCVFGSFSAYPQIPNFTKILPMGTELFHASRRTDRKKDMTKLEVNFRDFANTPENTD